ncbi:hypothetical protein [Burkholderia stagnalis]|uniref:hypothetical protein n=1 Tax=Burkholderia stagnalis TaxID=1503054 RepID=UPI000F564473|nr:hypothetical protein [Burkholderia stagnalis]RQQ65545.1 hypothetical protein DF137_22445 [Burkholderia stagnalis]RQQ78179.1 hypothetical protein DF138_21740 [Burkholderia stagnalis]RQQ87782.1 hypothetical protein DF136_21410 [Burkholderia stagnalis]
MQYFDINVPTTGAFVVHAPGRYIKYVSGNNGGGDARLVVTPGGMGGAKITLAPGQAYRVADDAAVPDSWTLANYAGGPAIVGQVVIGNGRIDDNSIAGTVQVVDGGKARTLNNSAFGIVGQASAVAGQYGRVQLWNAANTGVRLVVESIQVVNANAGGVGAYVQANAVQLATLVGPGNAKIAGGTSAKAMCYTDTNAVQGNGGESSLYVNPGTYQIKFAEPLVIPPGYGLLIYGATVNAALQVNFEWYEEPNV